MATLPGGRALPSRVPRGKLPRDLPAADVVPAEVARDDRQPLRPLHDGVVDRHRREGFEHLGERGVLLSSRGGGVQDVEARGQGGRVLGDRLLHDARAKEEHPRVPEVPPPIDEGLRPIARRLFDEPRHGVHAVADELSELDVPVARLGARREDADRREEVICGRRESALEDGAKGRLVFDEVVGGEDGNERIRIASGDGGCSPADGSCRVPGDGLHEELAVRYLRKRLPGRVHEPVARRDPDVLGHDEGLEAPHGRVDERLARAAPRAAGAAWDGRGGRVARSVCPNRRQG